MKAATQERCEISIRLDQDVAQQLVREMRRRKRQGIEDRTSMMTGIIEELVRKHLPPATDFEDPQDSLGCHPRGSGRVFTWSRESGESPDEALNRFMREIGEEG